MTSASAAIPQERHRGRFISNLLPRFSSPSSAEREKYASYGAKTPWIVILPVPLLRRHQIRFINSWKYALTITRFRRRRGSLFLLLLFVFFAIFVKVLFFRKERHTLVFRREDLQRIWYWEVSSGHFPSRQGSEYFYVHCFPYSRNLVPEEIQLRFPIENPALPPQLVSNYPSETYATTSRGTGPRRSYFDLRSVPAKAGFPPRPVPGSVVDLDIVMQHCAFERNKVCH
jgi:WD repeat and SOF domain-containing protein 1